MGTQPSEVSDCRIEGDVPDNLQGEIERWMDRIATHETIVLEALTFDLLVSNAHEYLAVGFGESRDSTACHWQGVVGNEDFKHYGFHTFAWSVANDSYVPAFSQLWLLKLHH